MESSNDTKKDEKKMSTYSMLGYNVPMWLIVLVVIVVLVLVAEKCGWIHLGIFKNTHKISITRELGSNSSGPSGHSVDTMIKDAMGNSASLKG